MSEVLAFMQLLWALVHRLDTTSKRMRSDLGVTGPQRLALRVVGLFPGVSAGELAAILHVHPSTLTGVLKRLTSQRLLVRGGDPLDRRRAVLRLTPLGTRVNAIRRGTVESAVGSTLSRVSSQDLRATTHVLRQLADRLAQSARADRPAPSRRRPRRIVAAKHARLPRIA